LIGDDDSRNAYLSALKGRDGLSSPSVLALTAHIAAYEQGAPGWMRYAVIWKKICTMLRVN
jgi:cystathionine beta-lyase